MLLLAAYLNKGKKFASRGRRNEERDASSLCYMHTVGEARARVLSLREQQLIYLLSSSFAILYIYSPGTLQTEQCAPLWMQLALPTAARRSLCVYTPRTGSSVLHPQLLLYQFAINLLLHLIYFLTHLHLLRSRSDAFIKRDAKNFVIIVALHSRCEGCKIEFPSCALLSI